MGYFCGHSHLDTMAMDTTVIGDNLSLHIGLTRPEYTETFNSLGIWTPTRTKAPIDSLILQLQTALQGVQCIYELFGEADTIDIQNLPLWPASNKISDKIRRGSLEEIMILNEASKRGISSPPELETALLELRNRLYSITNFVDSGVMASAIQEKKKEQLVINMRVCQVYGSH